MLKSPRLIATFITTGLLLLLAWHTIDVLTTPQPTDPYAPERAFLAWQEAQADTARWQAVKDGLVGVLAVLVGLGTLAGGAAAIVALSRATQTADLIYPDSEGRFPVPRRALNDGQLGAASVAAWHQTQALAARASRAVPTSYHKEIHGVLPDMPPLEGEFYEEAAAPQLPEPQPPGPFTFSAVRGRGFAPSAQQLYLAATAGDQALCTAAGRDPHWLLTGPTGEGKSNTARLLMGQYLAAGLDCAWLNPHPLQWEEKDRTDWRPITDRLRRIAHPRIAGMTGLVTHLPDITRYLAWLIDEELEARIRRGEVGQPLGPMLQLFVDEWPAILDYDRKNERYYSRLVREGRKYGLFLTMAAQDALVKTLGGSSGIREQFGVIYYYGGNQYTRGALEIPEDLGSLDGVGRCAVRVGSKGHWLRAQVPLMDNDSLYALLGRPASPPPWGWDTPPVEGTVRPLTPGVTLEPDIVERFNVLVRQMQQTAPEPMEPLEASTAGLRPGTETAPLEPLEASSRKAQARALLAQGVRPAEVVRRLWGLQTNKGRVADEAMEELTGWIKEWVQQAGMAPAEGQE